MAIPAHHRTNFETLKQAFAAGHVGLVECTDVRSREPVYALCAMSTEDDGEISLVPFATLIDGDPFELLAPPVLPDEPGHA